MDRWNEVFEYRKADAQLMLDYTTTKECLDGFIRRAVGENLSRSIAAKTAQTVWDYRDG